ncbi:MAG: tRNA (adenosine(37)-N6)-dimethylallyltransferase MiaA [Eubacteriales bacterium]
MKEIIAVAGPTASGKSALALSICERYGGELVSVDSMQVYRGMDIGTAKPDDAERARVPHHLIDICAPSETFSAADFAARAHEAIADIKARGHLPVLCGGTGLYMDTVIDRMPFSESESDPALREELRHIASERGAHELWLILDALDPQAAAGIHENNIKRVIRAIEICRTGGMTKTESDARAKAASEPYDALIIALGVRSRDVLYERINRRVDKMMAEGLLDEARRLYESGCLETNTTAACAIGYKELLGYIKGERSLAECTEDLKRATRRYAKRQLTWLSSSGRANWFYIDDYEKADELANDVFSLIDKNSGI